MKKRNCIHKMQTEVEYMNHGSAIYFFVFAANIHIKCEIITETIDKWIQNYVSAFLCIKLNEKFKKRNYRISEIVSWFGLVYLINGISNFVGYSILIVVVLFNP